MSVRGADASCSRRWVARVDDLQTVAPKITPFETGKGPTFAKCLQ